MRMEAVIRSVKTILELHIARVIQDLGKLEMEKPVVLWMLPTQQQVQSSSSKKDSLQTLEDPDRKDWKISTLLYIMNDGFSEE